MQLIIKHYLTLLTESKELDRLLPDLLLSMGIQPISKAQVGVRQYGVDVAAVGKDEHGVKTYFIFTIKQGDIARSDWDGSPQHIRPSLDEIKDVYISSNIENKYESLPKRIVLCTGGDMKQEVITNWTGYIEKNSIYNEVDYDFWGGDRLSLLIEKYLFNETILPKALQARFRKSIALISDPDYDLSDYYSILSEILLHTNYGKLDTYYGRRKLEKALRTINLCQNILYKWSKHEGNIKPALICSERTTLFAWEVLRRNHLYKNKKITGIFSEIHNTLVQIYSEYFLKVQPHCHHKNGFMGAGQHHVLENLNIFEHLGFLSVIGNLLLFAAINSDSKVELENAIIVKDSIKQFIDNHPASNTPSYDEHIIEISICFILLHSLGEVKYIESWINRTVDQITYAYRRMGKYFPIHSDSFDDLVSLNISGSINKEKLFEMSTLLPTLAHWCVSFGMESTYEEIRSTVNEFFPDCTLQIWYPGEETEEKLYIQNASMTGAVEAPIELPSFEEMKLRFKEVQKNTVPFKSFSSISHGFIALPIIASRHYRTPLLPIFWQANISEESSK